MKAIKTIGDNTICMLPSIIFNNKKSINPFFVSLLVPLFLASKYNQYLICFILFGVSLLVLMFLISPRKLILNSSQIQYHIFWKIKWSNVINFSLKNDVLTLETLDGKTRIVKNIDSDISKEIIDFINKKVNGRA